MESDILTLSPPPGLCPLASSSPCLWRLRRALGPTWVQRKWEEKVAMHDTVQCGGVALGGLENMDEAPGDKSEIPFVGRGGRPRIKKRDQGLRLGERRGEKRVRDEN